MSFIKIKLKKLKNMHKYLIFYISLRNLNKYINYVNFFLKLIINFLIINLNCIIIYKLYFIFYKYNYNYNFIFLIK